MGDGYVLDFTNRTFHKFIADTVGKDIDSTEYSYASGSKANRLRAFWKREPNHVVGRLVSGMIDYAEVLDRESSNCTTRREVPQDRVTPSGRITGSRY